MAPPRTKAVAAALLAMVVVSAWASAAMAAPELKPTAPRPARKLLGHLGHHGMSSFSGGHGFGFSFSHNRGTGNCCSCGCGCSCSCCGGGGNSFAAMQAQANLAAEADSAADVDSTVNDAADTANQTLDDDEAGEPQQTQQAQRRLLGKDVEEVATVKGQQAVDGITATAARVGAKAAARALLGKSVDADAAGKAEKAVDSVDAAEWRVSTQAGGRALLSNVADLQMQNNMVVEGDSADDVASQAADATDMATSKLDDEEQEQEQEQQGDGGARAASTRRALLGKSVDADAASKDEKAVDSIDAAEWRVSTQAGGRALLGAERFGRAAGERPMEPRRPRPSVATEPPRLTYP